ncbi:MAG: long-chain-fatty-acid--CoA ligase [Gammaproteobacteria bacterium RIFCSPHIGHO2_12_FULL_45_12]|nr:MAG: long-chain-fatty-acid--CoA ligase [Gammaproteobacteria bacterium RIFCSPHIGHO2_12_FULL_45_12]
MPSTESTKGSASASKVWLKSYSSGVPAEIDPDAFRNIPQIFQRSCELYRDRPAFYSMGVTLTFAEVDAFSRELAAYLQQHLQMKKGDRMAIMLPNVLQYPVALFAALRIGLVVVSINPLYTADELAEQLKNAEATTLLALANFANTVEQALARVPTLKHVIITHIGDLLPWPKAFVTHLVLKYVYHKIPHWRIPGVIHFKQAILAGKRLPLSPVDISPDDTAFLQYTGGTTGISKGAVLTHRNLIANMQQADAWFKSIIEPGHEIIITALPLYHIFSLLANCLYFSRIGGLNVLIANPRDIPRMVRDMRQFKFTAITGVNTLFHALIKYPAFSKLDFSCLRLALGGGMAVQRAVAEKWQAITGAPLLEAYGLTETSPCVTINPVTEKSYNGSIGLPVSSTHLIILDEEGCELPVGEAGELGIKGPQVMKGYWRNPAETEKVFTKDGWLLTGDIASMDEKGFFRLLERKKDMILVSGFNVYPNEIEDVLTRLAGISEAAVIGVSDENSGETVKAFIVKDDPALTAEKVVKYCREHLTPYKVPKYIEFTDELPKTNVGKILRRALKPT